MRRLWHGDVDVRTIASIALLVLLAGCSSETTPPASANQLLERMATAYRQAEAYSDHARAQLVYDLGGQHVDQTFPCSVALVRPNQLAMHFYGAHVVCDGTQLQATIDSLPQQILQVNAPARLGLTDVYRDEMLTRELAEGVAAGSVQLLLLLHDRPLDGILAGFEAPTLLEPADVAGAKCYRVQARGPVGNLVLWIDEKSYLLRKMEMPLEGLRGHLEANQAKVSNLTLAIDFLDARFAAPADANTFAISAPADAQVVDRFDVLPPVAIAPGSQPKKLRLAPLWKYDKLAAPTRVLVVPQDDKSWRALVIDGHKSIAELASDGTLVATHALELPGTDDEQRILTLVTTTDAAGKRFYAGLWPGNQQVTVFDEKFVKTLTYPDAVSAGGISDVCWADLDGDGQPDLNVGYYDVVGVQSASLDGRRKWSNRSLVNVFSLVATGPDADQHRHLLVTSETGKIARIDPEGRDAGVITVPDRFIRALFAEDLDGNGHPEVLGLAFVQAGEDTLVGFDAAGREAWTVPNLKFKPFQELIVAGDLTGSGTKQWIVASSDGTIRVINGDGQVVDQFNYGAAIAGLGVAQLDGPVLIVSSQQGIEALRVTALAP